MTLYRNFDPGRISMIWNSVLIQGLGPDTFVKCVRNEDAFNQVVGAQGDVVDVRNRNRSGLVTFTVLDASPTNDFLTVLALGDELTGLGFGALMIKDLNGTTLIKSAAARIKKFPDVEFAKDGGTNDWVLQCAEIEFFVGGSAI